MTTNLEKCEPNNLMRLLLDIFYLFIPLLEEFDTRRLSNDQSLRHLWDQALEIDAHVDVWEDLILPEDASYFSTRLGQDVLRQSSEAVHPGIAAALLYKEVFQIHLDKLLIDLLSHAPTAQTFERLPSTRKLEIDQWDAMERICPMFEYFFDDHMRLTGRMMYLLLFQTALIGISNSGKLSDQLFEEQTRACGLVCNTITAQGYLPWDECAYIWANLRNTYHKEQGQHHQSSANVAQVEGPFH